MKKSWYLIKREIAFLGGTIALIGVILAIFCAAFLSVVSVTLDVPIGLYEYADNNVKQLHSLSVAVKSITLENGIRLGSEWVYGTKDGLTTDVTLTGKNNKTWHAVVAELPNDPYDHTASSHRGMAFVAGHTEILETIFDGVLTEGSSWFDAPNQIIVTSTTQRDLGNVKFGETVLIGERPFTVVGVLNSNKVWIDEKERWVPVCSYYVSVPEDEVLDFCYLGCSSSRYTRKLYNTLRKDNSFEVYSNIAPALENVDLCISLFGAIAMTLGIMVLFIVYSLIAMFYRQRRAQICRFRLLGATSGTIAGVYCIIALVLGFVAVGIGAAGSLAFNKFFMNLCTELFDSPFVPHFYVAIPFALFGVVSLFILVLYWIYSAKIKNAQIAVEVRHE